jgi:hypothetical protein
MAASSPHTLAFAPIQREMTEVPRHRYESRGHGQKKPSFLYPFTGIDRQDRF